MALALLLLIPLLAAALTALPMERRVTPWPTLVSCAVVLGLALRVAWLASHGVALSGLGGGFSVDALGALLVLLIALVGATAALFSWGYLAAGGAHRELASESRTRLYYLLFNLFLASLLAVPLLSNLALIWVAVALTTLLSAFLVAHEDTPEALEAAWKYVILTTVGAVLALLGVVLLYWSLRQSGGADFTWPGLARAAPQLPHGPLWAGFLLILIGFGTKAGLAPMHTWLPDAHGQAPAPICALLSGVETSTALYVILRLAPILEAAGLHQARTWMLAFGIGSVVVAALLLIRVRDYKRMFAYSTVEHMGIILAAAGFAGGGFAVAFQIAAHALAKSLCFYAAGTVVLVTGSQQIAELRGLLRTAPTAALGLFAATLAVAGAPPFAVFMSELAVFRQGLADGRYVAVALLALFVVIAFCAMLRHVQGIVFGAESTTSAAPLRPRLPRACLAALVIAALPVLVFGLYLPPFLRDLLSAAGQAIGG